MNENIKLSEYQIFGGTLTERGVSIIRLSDRNTKAYINSESGRAALLREVTDEAVIEQVMAVWGDEPTVVIEPMPEYNLETEIIARDMTTGKWVVQPKPEPQKTELELALEILGGLHDDKLDDFIGDS